MRTGAAREEVAAVAHVLRRTTFGPFPGAVERALDEHGTAEAVLEAQLAADPVPFAPPATIDEPLDPDDPTRTNEQLVAHWLGRMSADEAGLHEKLMWFWHAHFTTSFMKSQAAYCWRQLRTLHQLAQGSFHELTAAIAQDAAMIQYLDGDDTKADEPNENLARELMELYTTGRGHYTEDDVRAASRALAGWVVSETFNGAERIGSWTLTEPVTFLGETRVHDPASVVDRIMAQEAVAPFVASKLARYFIGPEVAPSTLASWASQFRSSGYQIRPLVEEMLRSEEFARSRHARARSGIEWLCSLRRIVDHDRMEMWELMPISQVPYAPLSVAGWPDTWLSNSILFARIAFVERIEVADDLIAPAGDRARSALERCGLHDVSDETRSAIEALDRGGASGGELVRAALSAPEFALA